MGAVSAGVGHLPTVSPARRPFEPIHRRKLRYGSVTVGGDIPGTPPPVAPSSSAAFVMTSGEIVSINTEDPAVMVVLSQVWTGDFDENGHDQLVMLPYQVGGVDILCIAEGDNTGNFDVTDVTDPNGFNVVDQIVDSDLENARSVAVDPTQVSPAVLFFATGEDTTTVCRIESPDVTATALTLTETLVDGSLVDVKATALLGTVLAIPIHEVPGVLIAVETDPTLSIADSLTLSDNNQCSDVQASGTHAFVLGTNGASDEGALTAVDLSNPASISEASTLTDPAFFGGWCMALVDDHVYVGTSAGEIVAIDISDPNAMTIEAIAATIPSCTFVTSICAVGGYLFCTVTLSGDDGVAAISIADPTNISFVSAVQDSRLNFAGSIAAH